MTSNPASIDSDLSWTLRGIDGYLVLALVGDLDRHPIMLIRDILDELDARGPYRPTTMIIDLSEIGFMSSAGVSTLCIIRQRVLALRGTLRVVCANPNLLSVFRITGLDQLLEIYPCRRSALAVGRASGDPPLRGASTVAAPSGR